MESYRRHWSHFCYDRRRTRADCRSNWMTLVGSDPVFPAPWRSASNPIPRLSPNRDGFIAGTMVPRLQWGRTQAENVVGPPDKVRPGACQSAEQADANHDPCKCVKS